MKTRFQFIGISEGTIQLREVIDFQNKTWTKKNNNITWN